MGKSETKKERVMILVPVNITYDTPQARKDAMRMAKSIFVDGAGAGVAGSFSAKSERPKEFKLAECK